MRARRRLLRVSKRVLAVFICDMYEVLSIKASRVRGNYSHRRDHRYLRDGNLHGIFSVYELRRAEHHLHLRTDNSSGPPSVFQERYRRLADFDSGMQ